MSANGDAQAIAGTETAAPSRAAVTDWVRQPLSCGAAHATAVDFVDADHGWVACNSDYQADDEDERHSLLLYTTDGGATWGEHVLPGDIYDVIDITFADQRRGWLIADCQEGQGIFTTNDGGATWTVQALNLGQGDAGRPLLEGVTCVDASHCWVVCDSGGVFGTSDGGATWARQADSNTPWLDVTFVDASRGWAVGEAYQFATPAPDFGWVPTPAIMATTDGGRTWSQQGVFAGSIDQAPYSSVDLQAVSFADAAHGWAVGWGYEYGRMDWVPLVFSTTDGGANWQAQTVPAGTTRELTGVAFSDASHGWVVGQGGTVLLTSDGGATWTRQTVRPVTNLLDTVCAGGHAWAIGRDGAIFTSTDKGADWTVQALPAGTALTGVASPDGTHGWAVGDFDAFEGDQGSADFSASVILTTSNAGAAWSLQGSPPGVRDLEAVTFADATHGWAVGGTYDYAEDDSTTYRAAIVATSDGGATWKTQTVPSGIHTLCDVDFVDALHGWAVGYSYLSGTGFAGAILATSDGGATWKPQTVPAGTGWLSSVDFADASHGWAVVQRTDAILMTSDGGATWTLKHATTNGIQQYLYDVAFADIQHGLTVGLTETEWEDHSVVVRTADGGQTWKRQKLDSYDTLLAADLLDANRGWAVGEKGLACVTTDGGATWIEQTVPTGTGTLRDVDIVDATHGWAVGYADPETDGCVILALSGSAPPATDTTPPTTKAYAASVRKGAKVKLAYQVVDPAPSCGQANVVIKIYKGAKAQKTIRVPGAVACNVKLTYAWKCTLAAGSYTLRVYATDLAGNAQSKVGSAKLTVK
jgi:photosystem II stability/assembly factor-like uncharacterized protein